MTSFITKLKLKLNTSKVNPQYTTEINNKNATKVSRLKKLFKGVSQWKKRDNKEGESNTDRHQKYEEARKKEIIGKISSEFDEDCQIYSCWFH